MQNQYFIKNKWDIYFVDNLVCKYIIERFKENEQLKWNTLVFKWSLHPFSHLREFVTQWTLAINALRIIQWLNLKCLKPSATGLISIALSIVSPTHAKHRDSQLYTHKSISDSTPIAPK